jgi:tRNA-2-methylthio-N6-dimethylallyladenosine synthase
MGDTVYLESFGCQMNKLDSELLLGSLRREGYLLAASDEEADVILLNTCSVREHAEEKVFSRAGLLKRRRAAVIGVIGCMARNHQAGIVERLPHVNLVCGPRQFGAIPRLIGEIRRTGQRRVVTEEFDDEFLDPTHAEELRDTPFQAYVKVMEGCDLACAFCIVPRVRGAEVSRPPEAIVEEVRRLAAEGVVEVTLLGQTVNSYGKGLRPRIDLAGLLARLHEIEGIRRLRFITSHPSFVRRSLVEALRDLPRVCKYLHIPPQSGSDRVLAAMKRGYTRARYLALVEELRAEVPALELAGDFIVGFPGETEEEFEQTAELMERVRFQNSFVFKYSPRPGTAAAGLPDDVPEADKRRRNARLLEIQKRHSEGRNAALVGRTLEVLVEGPSKTNPERLTGRTDTHRIAVFEGPAGLAGRFVGVTIEEVTGTTLYGRLARG